MNMISFMSANFLANVGLITNDWNLALPSVSRSKPAAAGLGDTPGAKPPSQAEENVLASERAQTLADRVRSGRSGRRQSLHQVAQGPRLADIARKDHVGQVFKALRPIQAPDRHTGRDLAQYGCPLAAQALLGQLV